MSHQIVVIGQREEPGEDIREELLVQARRALSQWKTAENFLNYACDKDMVECAVFDLEAARRKYEFLLKKLRTFG